MAARLTFVILAVIVFVVDRVTKLLVEERMYLGERIQVVGDVFELRRVHNPGIAFGLFSDAGFLVVFGSLLVGALLFFFMLRVEPDDWFSILGGACITGGALGNLVDRIQHGYVVDFLHLPRWPTFNVADIGIVVGVALVIVSQLLVMRRESRETAAAEEPPVED
ncbi:MAG: lspA [Thermoleophilia bacterium]|nr:lspA [Thermoleophilia bacterium]